jgi:hypothetical protein
MAKEARSQDRRERLVYRENTVPKEARAREASLQREATKVKTSRIL